MGLLSGLILVSKLNLVFLSSRDIQSESTTMKQVMNVEICFCAGLVLGLNLAAIFKFSLDQAKSGKEIHPFKYSQASGDMV